MNTEYSTRVLVWTHQKVNVMKYKKGVLFERCTVTDKIRLNTPISKHAVGEGGRVVIK